MKTRFTAVFISIIFMVGGLFAKEIPVDQARNVALNFIYEQTGQKIGSQSLSWQEFSLSEAADYYIFNIKGGGFVIVSAEDNFYPIIGYSFENEFKTENMPENLSSWMHHYAEQIEYVRANNIQAENANLWTVYNVPVDKFNHRITETKIDYILPTATWDQGNGYNTYCPEDDGPGGRAYTGCVATAMSIIMKYWDYPLQGLSSHSYYDYPHGTLSANFGSTYYMWELMPDDGPSDAVALLMYHAGVSVEMNYGGNTEGGSGAYSYDVPDALVDYFRYDNSIQYLTKSNYSSSEWTNIIESEIDANRVVYYSGSSDEGGHAFVCDGYRTDDNYFHFNFGWGGNSNGFYAQTDVNGFSSRQDAIINIMPGDSNFEFNTANAPIQSITAQLDTNDLDTYKNLVEWTAPAKGTLTGYNIYRGTEYLSNLETSVHTYTDYPSEVDNYVYVVRAVYDDGIAEGVSATAKGLFTVTFRVFDSINNELYSANVEFAGKSQPTLFVGAIFNDVPFGGPYTYTISKDGYPTTTGTIAKVYKDMTVYVVMGQNSAGMSENSALIVVYPNPSNGIISFDGLQTNNKIAVYDAQGKVVYTQENIENNSAVDLSFLSRGIYFVNIQNGKQVVNHRIIIK